jgi:cation transport ATPase
MLSGGSANAANHLVCGGATVSKADGDNLDPLDFDLPDDDLTASGEELDSADESALPEESGLDEALDDLEEAVVSDDETEETVSKLDRKKKKRARKPKIKKPKERKPRQESEEEAGLVAYLVWAVCGISCLSVLVADVMILASRGSSSIVFIILLTVIWLMGTAIPFMLWKGRRTNTAYVVFLGISLAGILVANLLLLLELATYGGDIGEKGTQQSLHVAPAVQSAPDNTSATA